jgi:hypothetical protein
MADNEPRSTRLAVLIDGDNVSPAIVDRLFADVRALGEPIVRRVYGDNLDKWKLAIRKYALKAEFVVPNVGRKNAADFALVIGAMDVLHEGQVGGFCLVSSDSDFTALAIRLTGAGYPVYGFGSKRTPEPLRSALTRFTPIDGSEEAKAPTRAAPARKAAPAKEREAPPVPAPRADNEAAITEAIEATKRADGWTSLNDLGKALRERGIPLRRPAEKLRKLASLEVDGTGNALRVRVKPKSPRRKRAKQAG